MNIVKVAATSDPNLVAGAIAGMARAGTPAAIRAAGQKPVYTALKALIVANRYLQADGIHLATEPQYATVDFDGVERTVVVLPVSIQPADRSEQIEDAGEPIIVRVAAGSQPGSVAGAIAKCIRSGAPPIVQAIGTPAVYLAIKALVIARTYLAQDGIAIATTPDYHDVEIEGTLRTAIRLPVIAVLADASTSDLG